MNMHNLLDSLLSKYNTYQKNNMIINKINNDVINIIN